MGNAGISTKVWYYKYDDRINVVMLRHDTLRKQKTLYLNGNELADLSDEKFDHETDVALPGGIVGCIKVETTGMLLLDYSYTFSVNGKDIPSYEDIEDDEYHISARIKSVEKNGEIYVIEALETHNDKLIHTVKTDHSKNSFEKFFNVLKSYGLSFTLEKSNVTAEKDQINDFLAKLLRTPHNIAYNPDVRKFLGLNEEPSRLPTFASSSHIVLDFSGIK